MNRISTVNDKHTPALTPLALANPRNWSLLRLVQFAVAGIELPSILVAIFEIETWFQYVYSRVIWLNRGERWGGAWERAERNELTRK